LPAPPARATLLAMRPVLSLLATVTFFATSGCVAPTGPVEVTRFHVPDMARLAHGAIAIEAATGIDGDSLEFRSYAAAVSRELQRVGYSELVAGGRSSAQVAIVSVERAGYRGTAASSPVSIGVGGATGSYGSGLGMGVGLNLSGPSPEQTETRLAVTIRERASGQALWEGRASFTVRASSPLAQTQLGAARLAEALFRDFPGRSGETILVR
jgi:hypothetical protein